jgi:hypothetical protein
MFFDIAGSVHHVLLDFEGNKSLDPKYNYLKKDMTPFFKQLSEICQKHKYIPIITAEKVIGFYKREKDNAFIKHVNRLILDDS